MKTIPTALTAITLLTSPCMAAEFKVFKNDTLIIETPAGIAVCDYPAGHVAVLQRQYNYDQAVVDAKMRSDCLARQHESGLIDVKARLSAGQKQQ